MKCVLLTNQPAVHIQTAVLVDATVMMCASHAKRKKGALVLLTVSAAGQTSAMMGLLNAGYAGRILEGVRGMSTAAQDSVSPDDVETRKAQFVRPPATTATLMSTAVRTTAYRTAPVPDSSACLQTIRATIDMGRLVAR